MSLTPIGVRSIYGHKKRLFLELLDLFTHSRPFREILWFSVFSNEVGVDNAFTLSKYIYRGSRLSAHLVSQPENIRDLEFILVG